MRKAARFIRCEGGYSAIETSIMIGIIVVALGIVTGAVSGMFGTAADTKDTKSIVGGIKKAQDTAVTKLTTTIDGL